MRLLHLAIFSVLLAVSSISLVRASENDLEVKNLLAIGINDEAPFPFIEFYNAKIDIWHALRTVDFNITDYGVAIYRDRLLLIGGLRNSDGNFTDQVNEVDLLSGQIETVGYLNHPRSNPSVAVVGEGKSTVLYILGGKSQSGVVTATVERWDESEQKWISVRSMISPCEGAAVVVHNDDIYVMGGFNGELYTDTVQFYNTTSGMWSIKWPMDEIKGHFHGASDGKFIFVVGGFADHSDPNSELNSVDRYDPESDVWTSLANISRCSGSVGVNFLNDQLYAVGGTYCSRAQIYHENNNTWQFLNPLAYDRTTHTILRVPFQLKDYEFDWIPGNRSMKNILVTGTSDNEINRKLEVYHPENDSWQVLDHEITGTRQYRVAFVNDRLIIAGGFNTFGSITDEVFEISLETGEASKLSPMIEKRVRSGMLTIGEGLSARLYVIGGWGTSVHQKTVERWDPFTDTWEYVSSLNIARGYMAAVEHKGNIYIFGGYISTAIDDSEVYFVEEDRWESISPMLQRTYFCEAVSDGTYIYVVGGTNGSALNIVQRYDASTDTWKMLAPTTSTRTMGISLLNNAPIVFGGSSSNVVEIYDVEKDEWRQLAPMNYRREIYNAMQVPWKWKYSKFV